MRAPPARSRASGIIDRVTSAHLSRRLRAEVRFSGRAAWRGLLNLLNGDDMTYAASIAYYAILSLFPFLLLVISLLGVVTASDEDRATVLSFVFRYFPTRLDFVATQLDAFRDARLRVGLMSALALVWASLGFFSAVTSAVNLAWGVAERRGFLKHRLVSFLMLVAAGGSAMLGLALVAAVRVAEASWFGILVGRFVWLTTLQSFAFRYLATLVLIMSVGLVFYFVPNAKIRFRDVWVGAVLTGLLWRAAFTLFAWYLTNNSRLTVIQGSLTAVIAFLLWAYVSAVVLMYGVEFTAAYSGLRNRGRKPPELDDQW